MTNVKPLRTPDLDASDNGIKKLNPAQKEFVIQALGNWASYAEIIDALLQTNGIELSISSVSYYNKKDAERIKKLRAEHAKNIFDLYPIANRDWRVKQLQKHYDATPNIDTRCRILNQVRQEIGEDIEKLAKALRDSGDRSYTFDFSGLESHAKDKLGADIGRAFSVGIPISRF